MTNPFYQGVNPPVTPDPVTPADSPGDPAGYAGVTPPGMGTAPYDISAPQDLPGFAAAADAATALTGGAEGADTGAGIPDRNSARQQEALSLLTSPQGAGAMNILAGFPDYENADVSPGPNSETPIQGMGTYPGTRQDGIPQYGAGEGSGVTGVLPPTGSMGPGGGDYPGTMQDGVQKYGTS